MRFVALAFIFKAKSKVKHYEYSVLYRTRLFLNVPKNAIFILFLLYQTV